MGQNLAVFDSQRPWRSWFPAERGLADLLIRRIFGVPPVRDATDASQSEALTPRGAEGGWCGDLMQRGRVAVARQARRMSWRAEGRAYPVCLTGTEAGAAIKPVIIPEFVDLHPSATIGRLQVQRHDPAGNGDSSLRASPG